MQKAIDDQSSGGFVQLVFDWLSANRDFDDDVHVIWWIVLDLDRIDPHEDRPDLLNNRHRMLGNARLLISDHLRYRKRPKK